MNPDDLNQMAQLGKQVYNSLPTEAQASLVLPASQEAGKGLGSIMTILSYPFNSLALGLNNKLDKRAKLLEQETTPKIENLKEKGLYTEDGAGLAIKALELSKYSLDSEILRSYFSELITNSLNSERINDISPNFANILSNLSNDDALFLQKLKHRLVNSRAVPFIRITATLTNNQGENILLDNIIGWGKGKYEELGSTLHVLESFGLIEHRFDGFLSDDSSAEIYKSFKKSDSYHSIESEIADNLETWAHANIKKGTLQLTELGVLFLNVVVV